MTRYDRVRAVQKTGETTRDRWHKTDWAKVAEDPKSISFPREDWIHQFDAEKHAEEVFDEIFMKVTSPDTTQQSTLLPVGPIGPTPVAAA
jgi:hypothetical protein